MFQKEKIKRGIFLLILTVFFLTSPAATLASTPAWPDFGGHAFGNMLEEIRKNIHGVILGVLKQAAAQMINEAVNQLVSSGGPGGGPLFVTDWEDYLYKQPHKKTDLWMNDFFTVVMGGTASTANYRAAGGEGVIGSHQARLVKSAQQSTTRATTPTYSLNQYVSDPSQIFEAGNWRAFNAYISNPVNNDFGMTLMAQSAYMDRLQTEQSIASDKSKAYSGYEAVEKDGQVITPGSTIKDIQSQTEDLGNKIIAGATNAPEVITAVVTKLVTKTIKQGIGNSRSNTQRSTGNTYSNYQLDAQKQSENYGPGASFQPNY